LCIVTVPGLPPGYSARRPTLRDAAAILAVVHAAERDALGRDDSSLAEVRELLRLPRTRPDTDQWLVEANGRATAWGMVIDEYGGEQVDLDVYADPAHPEQVRQALLDVLMERVREHAAHRRTGEVIVGAGVIVGDEPYAAALRDRGFVIERRFNRLRVELDSDRPFPAAPPGVALDRFDPTSDPDWKDWHDILLESFADHWGHEPMDLPAFQESVTAEDDPEFDRWHFAVVDGRRAGICQPSGRFAAKDGGWIRNLGVVPGARGRGARGTCSSTRWPRTPRMADDGPGSASTRRTSVEPCASTNPLACGRGCRSTRSAGGSAQPVDLVSEGAPR
jgi:mycothiol synthase